MSSTADVTNPDLRRSIKETVTGSESPHRSDVLDDVADSLEVDGDRVAHELDQMEKNGFVYLVNGEVRLP